jgi:hypothetical protein
MANNRETSQHIVSDDTRSMEYLGLEFNSRNQFLRLVRPSSETPTATQIESIIDSNFTQKSHFVNSRDGEADTGLGYQKDARLIADGARTIQSIQEEHKLPLFFTSDGLANDSVFVNTSSKGSPCSSSHQEQRIHSPLATQSILQPTLGSILSFMETRCKTGRKRNLESNPYFEERSNKSKDMSPICHPSYPTVLPSPNSQHTSAPWECSCPFPQSEVKKDRIRNPLTLIISTALLQVEIELVRELEKLPPGSKLIYRDYDSSKASQSLSDKMQSGPPAEADIIVSPNAGILLTTSHETTQQNLPGHKSKVATGISCCASPLQERIFALCPRYDRLYVLVRLPTEQQPNGPDRTSTNSVTIDNKNLSAFRGLSAFCHSLSQSSTIILRLVSWSPPSIVDMVCAITEKHSGNMNGRNVHPALPGGNYANTTLSNSFTNLIHEVTPWELFLCQAGLNPFAAQIILVMMTERVHAHQQQLPPPPQPVNDPEKSKFFSMVREEPKRGYYPNHTSSPQGLSAFIEMSVPERASIFGSIVGEKVLQRVNIRLNTPWLV